MNKKNFLSLSLITPFIMGQIIIAPVAAGLLMFRGILLDNPRRKAALKQAEEALRDSEEKLRLIFASIPDSISVINLSGKVIDVNHAGIRLFGGTSKDQFIGRDGFDFIASSDKDRAVADLPNIFHKETGGPREYRIRKNDGSEFDGEVIATMMRGSDGKPEGIITVIRDVTERKRVEKALRESEEMSRSMLDNAAMGVYLLQDKKFLYVNPTFEKIIGYTSEELVGRDAINYVHPNDRGTVRTKAVENLKGISSLPYEFRVLRKDGRQIWVIERVASIKYKGRRAVIASFMETTEHRKAQVELEHAYEELKKAHEHMVQTEKLRAMGEMASGIAHDFNNMLAVILGRTQLLMDDVKDKKVKKAMQIIENAALDAAKTVKRLQESARKRPERAFEQLVVNQVVEDVLTMIEPRLTELEQTKRITIKVEKELEKVEMISGDAAELREALLNILFNATDAMPNGGKLTVKIWQDNEWVQISIKDTGVGIPEKIKNRIFEPFFTTKASKGSGLGLSVTYGIIARHGGMIKFDSVVDQGTTFYIKLPLAVETAKKEIKKGKAVKANSANILAVDDEPEVLKALVMNLEHLGHWVKGFTSGAEAIKAFKDGNYNLVITDLGMPEVSGWDVTHAIKEIKPDTPVLMITGWALELDEDQKKIVDGIIAKPFSRDSISSAIAQVFPTRKDAPGYRALVRGGIRYTIL
jgi:PAS domain S-box-containing protein